MKMKSNLSNKTLTGLTVRTNMRAGYASAEEYKNDFTSKEPGCNRYNDVCAKKNWDFYDACTSQCDPASQDCARICHAGYTLVTKQWERKGPLSNK